SRRRRRSSPQRGRQNDGSTTAERLHRVTPRAKPSRAALSWGVRAAFLRIFLIALLGLPRLTGAQSNFARPALNWTTVRTKYFEVHYPAPMSEWALDLVSRIDAVHDAVSAVVGYAPHRRITVIVEDPLSQSNGFANSPLADPIIV